MHLLHQIAVLLLIASTHSFQFYLDAKSRKCFREDLPLSMESVFKYTVAQGEGDMPIALRITDSLGHLVHEKGNIDHGVFTFRTPDSLPGLRENKDRWALHDDERDEEDDAYWRANPGGAGDNRLSYRFCFEHSTTMGLPNLSFGGRAMRRTVIFSILAGPDTKTMEYYDKLAKEKHLSSTEELFRVVEDRVSDIVRLIDEMRQRELRLDHMSVKTNRTVLWYSLFTCLTIAAGALATSYGTFRQLSRQKVI
eukprot:GFKZ01014840.1.p1 GENE.GFKZ01014840.1~~GFKZ01014840.1.p1  ORF type:complete len:252 (-),score=14.92 GFKZ01014840.1:409-1164(-)